MNILDIGLQAQEETVKANRYSFLINIMNAGIINYTQAYELAKLRGITDPISIDNAATAMVTGRSGIQYKGD